VKPELRRFGSLTAEDFERFPVWLGCHVADYDEPWYEDTDEETFRPWTGDLPVSPADGMYLVKATATLADGSSLPAFLTPAAGNDLGLVQPQAFISRRLFSFWGGMPGVPKATRDDFYAALGKGPDAEFPIQFIAPATLVQGGAAVEVAGFYRSPDPKTALVER
jgi:hypothetical protein